MATRIAERAPATAPPRSWTIDDSRRLYNIEGWGLGYFDISADGHVTVRPDKAHPERELDLFELAKDLEQQGVGMPLLLRCSEILRSRIESLSQKFGSAMEEVGYDGSYTTGYPIEVNEQRHGLGE